MRVIKSIIFAFLLLGFSSSMALSQRIISALSDKEILIDQGFTGETLTIFGNIEPNIGAKKEYLVGPFSIAVIIQGPVINRVVRKKSYKFGIWLNSEQLIFEKLPSYYWLLSSEKPENFASNEILQEAGLLPIMQPFAVSTKGEGEQKIFSNELVRLMKEKGLFGINENGVKFHSNSLYSINLELPSDVPVGSFLATTYLFKGGEIIHKRSEGFSVRKTGFERLLGTSAKQSPFFYGVFTVLLALFTGWLGGVAFRR